MIEKNEEFKFQEEINTVLMTNDGVKNTKEPKRTTYSYNDVIETSKKYFNGEELPSKVFADKYAMKDSAGNIYENNPDQMHHRLAKEFGKTELKFKDKVKEIDSKKMSDYWVKRESLTTKKIYNLFKDFKYIVPQGSVMSILGNEFVIGSLSNCIVIPELYDSYGGIMFADQELVQLMKRRCGVGMDLSTLRPDGVSVTNAAGTSTGPISFMERFSNTTREVAQSGRRGALMLSMDIEHPDIEKFIVIKQDLTKVTGANISVRLSDEFMLAVKNNTTYTHRWPLDENRKNGELPVITKTINAVDLWNIIIKAAHTSAEPGLIFWDRQHKYSTSSVYPEFRNTSTNPCLTSDTWITTTEGPKQVQNLIGKQFISFLNGKENISTDEGFFCTGNKKVFKLKTKNGFEIKATENHPFRKVISTNRKNITSEMAELKDVKIGDSLYLANDRTISWGNNAFNSDIETGWLVGSLLGDGTIHKDRAYLGYWGDSKFEMRNQAISYVKNNIGYRDGFFGEGTETTYDTKVHNRTRIGSSELKKIAEKYGVSKDKNLNNKIEESSSDFYRGFLSGWFDSDGTVSFNSNKGASVRLSSSILNNLKIAQRMLARLGIISKIYENRKIEGWYEMPDGKGGVKSFCKAGHELIITKDNIAEFYHSVGFKEKTKQEKIKSIIDNHKRGFYRERFIDVITEITEIGVEQVFDCTVFPDHEFEANGFLVHNCSEIAMQGGDSCRLIAMNLFGFINKPFEKEASFDFDKFYEITYESQRLMDDLVELELDAIDKIINKINSDPEPNNIKEVELQTWKTLREAGLKGRRTGLGFTALGDTIAALGFKFDSKEALEFVDKMMRVKLSGEFDSSIDMSIERGSFGGFNPEIEETSDFIKMMKTDFPKIYNRMMLNGRRNISISTVAPTGSLSILTQTSSGLEPVFMTSYKRRKKINDVSDKNIKVDFIDELGDKWQEFIIYHPKLKMWMDVTGETDETKSPYKGSTSPEIDWVKRVEMQSIIQKYITHSISSTINLPNDVSIEKVGEIYLKSWEMGLKGITVYRDGSRSGILVSNDSNKGDKRETIYEFNAPKRPKALNCDLIRFTNKGEKWLGFIGLFDERPYEVFTGKAENINIPNHVENGKIRKTKIDGIGKYDFIYNDKDGVEVVVEWLNKSFDEYYWNYAKMLSGILRHGMPLPYVVDLVNSLNLDGDIITTWKNGVARMIKKYIPNGTKATDKLCKECKSESVIYQEGCLICTNCGSSKCG